MDDNENKKPDQEKESTQGNVVLAKFKKDQKKEDRHKKWRVVSEAVDAARQAYTGGYGTPKDDVKLASFDTTVEDLIEVLQKILKGEVKLGGLGENCGGIELPVDVSD